MAAEDRQRAGRYSITIMTCAKQTRWHALERKTSTVQAAGAGFGQRQLTARSSQLCRGSDYPVGIDSQADHLNQRRVDWI